MKLLICSLFSLVSLAPVHAQGNGEWTNLDRDIQAKSAKLTSLVIYEVRDIATKLGEGYYEPDWNAPGEAEKRAARLRHPVPAQPAIAHADNTTKEPVDPAVREALVLTGTTRLADVITTNIEPALESNLHTITVAGAGSLAVVATQAQHEWIKRVLKLAQQTALPQFETRWVVGPSGSFEKFGLKPGANPQTQAEFAALLVRTQDDGSGVGPCKQINACSIMVHNLSRASIRTSDAITYVKDWVVRRALPGPKDFAVPEIATLEPGNMLQVRAVLIEPNVYRCALNFEHSTVKQPIRTAKIPLSAAPGGEAEVALPEMDIQRFSTDAKLADGAGLAIVVPFDDKQDLALLIKLTAVAPQAPAAVEHK